jgi:ABC-type Fe3+/spermidine/putrescine transport system ATPase subunit
MHQGEILQVGVAEDIYERPATRFVATFFGTINLFEGTVAFAANGSFEVAAEGLGQFSAPAPLVRDGRRLEPGDSIGVAVRPECVELRHYSEEAVRNAYAGVVRRVVYGGSERRYEIELAAGGSLEAKVAGPAFGPTAGIAEGAPVKVTWPAEATKVLTE